MRNGLGNLREGVAGGNGNIFKELEVPFVP
jgi:hypothetical protein